MRYMNVWVGDRVRTYITGTFPGKVILGTKWLNCIERGFYLGITYSRARVCVSTLGWLNVKGEK